MLIRQKLHEGALVHPELLSEVSRNNELYFPDNNAHYNTAKIGTLKLVPTTNIQKQIAQDYKNMNEMFFSKPPSFNEILSVLEEAESFINKHKVRNHAEGCEV